MQFLLMKSYPYSYKLVSHDFDTCSREFHAAEIKIVNSQKYDRECRITVTGNLVADTDD